MSAQRNLKEEYDNFEGAFGGTGCGVRSVSDPNSRRRLRIYARNPVGVCGNFGLQPDGLVNVWKINRQDVGHGNINNIGLGMRSHGEESLYYTWWVRL